MALVSMLTELKKAQQGRYGIPSFNTFDSRGADGIFAALAEKRAPGIVAIYSGVFDQPQGGALTAYVRKLAEQALGPVAVLLDHGASFEHCVKALTLGCTDVMFDGSKLSLEENIATAKLVVRAAHKVGASVEAELGHVGRGSEYRSFGLLRKGFTKPDEVERFVAETGVDSLAIAIGTAHGKYECEPQLALDLLDDIRQRVAVPLVLHGGSGLAAEQFRAAIAGGITKVNIFTAMAEAATVRMADVARVEAPSYFGITTRITEAFKERAMAHLDIFGATGRATNEAIEG